MPNNIPFSDAEAFTGMLIILINICFVQVSTHLYILAALFNNAQYRDITLKSEIC